MKRLLISWAVLGLLAVVHVPAQAQGPGDATLTANNCANLQVLRNGQPLDIILGMQLQEGDQVICGDGSFTLGYADCELAGLQRHSVSTDACDDNRVAGTPLPTPEQAGIIAAASVGIGVAFAAGQSDDDDIGFVFDSALSPAAR
jgi:hypothetical protein